MITSYEVWLEQAPDYIKRDQLWDMDTYRRALFMSDLAWHDCEILIEFLKIALGSARESRGWYFRGRYVLKSEVVEHRSKLIGTIIAGLITMSNQQRRK